MVEGIVRLWSQEMIQAWDNKNGFEFECVAGWYWQYSDDDAPCGPFPSAELAQKAYALQLKKDIRRLHS